MSQVYWVSWSCESLRMFWDPADMRIFMFLFLWSSFLGKGPWRQWGITLLHGAQRLCVCVCVYEVVSHDVKFLVPLCYCFSSCQGRETSMFKWLHVEKKQFPKEPWHSSDYIENLGGQVPVWKSWQLLPIGKTFLPESVWVAETQVRARWWNGLIDGRKLVDISGKGKSLTFTNLVQFKSDLLLLCQAIPSGPDTLSSKGILWPT